MSRIPALFERLFRHPAFESALSMARDGARPASPIVVSGLTRPAKAVMAAGLSQKAEKPVILVPRDNESAELLATTAAAVLEWLEPGAGKIVAVLPALDCTPYEGRSPHPDILERRAVALWNLAQKRTKLLCAPVTAALGRFRDASSYRTLALELKLGDEVRPEDLTEHLLSIGYESAEPVTEAGQFSVRGGIVDVFSPEAARPLRIEFLGDAIESLREFDPDTQRSCAQRASALLLPLSETSRSPKFFETLTGRLSERIRKSKPGVASGATTYAAPFPGWEFYAPLVEPHSRSLFDLLENPLVLWDDACERRDQAENFERSLRTAYDETRDAIPPRPEPSEIYWSAADFINLASGFPQIELEELSLELAPPLPTVEREVTDQPAGARPAAEASAAREPQTDSFTLLSQPSPKFCGSIKAFVDDVQRRVERGESVILALPAPGKAERLLEVLGDSKIPFEVVGDGTAEPLPASPSVSNPFAVLIAPGLMPSGVVFRDFDLAILSDQDIFGDFGRPLKRRERSGASAFISDLSDVKPGDYLVHVDHGIGIYRGLRQLEVSGSRQDFMLLEYRDEAKLYVPLERLDLVEKYRSTGEGAKPEPDRLGGSTWQRTKKRVQKALRDMAQDLLRLSAERKMRGRAAYSPDTVWQKEFEEGFAFEETPDQIATLEEIKRDLERSEPMDRLLCGDVGYGKTELAMRAAFKVVQESKQVAVLAPTTVLAFQHSLTFTQRMAAFPVRIELLSRFRSASEQKKVLAEIEAGKVDIVIGTHRLLSKDVKFHDLGLLVVDEEQRFGVAAKERLKNLRANVDVLTLSATPIPRTLHMAIGGLRDLSVIESPPRGRLAIQTTVAPFGPGIIRSAILQEMEREGQVYFVHNRIESIFTIAETVQKLVPEARLGVVHGQMGERELERTMMNFVEGRYAVLVATALIENGLDIPRANTLIVNHADRFGLADLYQLRGRVGRSDRRAYAYFLVPSEETLSPVAKRRLAALKEFSDLGSGFRLAALDLELRGAGNVLGREQHGHLNAIGVDLYLRMLEQTVAELQGAPRPLEVHTTLNLGVDIKIPHDYIRDERQRLKMYKQISAIATPEARREIEAELADRFGAPPASVDNLLDYALLKSRAESLLVQSIERKDGEIQLRFHEQTPLTPEGLRRFLRRHKEAGFGPEGVLHFKAAGKEQALISQICEVLLQLQSPE